MASVRERGSTVIVIAHRPSAISVLDQLMMIRDGQIVAFGPKDEVLRKVLARPVEVPRSHEPLDIVLRRIMEWPAGVEKRSQPFIAVSNERAWR
jgi:ABC-type multidrug transport system ATPase subunit